MKRKKEKKRTNLITWNAEIYSQYYFTEVFPSILVHFELAATVYYC